MNKWSRNQICTVFAAVSSWGLDAFDFFLLIFVIDDIARSFSVSNKEVALAIFLTLACRPIGAVFIGKMAEKYGRKPVLMANVATFSILSGLSAFAPTLFIFLAIRCAYGVAMGGIWGVASALAFETIPPKTKGFISGLFQAGYPLGYLSASVIYGLFFDYIRWQDLFLIGTLPIFLVAFIYFFVEESSVWQEAKNEKKENLPIIPVIIKNWPVCIYAIILMTCFNFFSHGTQDVYPLFLKDQHHFTTHTVSIIAILYNIASIIGGVSFGTLSQKIGRPQAMTLAAFFALCAVPLWAFSSSVVLIGLGAFIMQLMVQGAWGIIPIYLTELMPKHTRAVLPGVAYQLGNLLASINLPLQIYIAESYHGDYSISLASVASITAICIMLLMVFNIKKTSSTI